MNASRSLWGMRLQRGVYDYSMRDYLWNLFTALMRFLEPKQDEHASYTCPYQNIEDYP